jgi:radical SAM protein with 4Fe4S-binding SPASM domain
MMNAMANDSAPEALFPADAVLLPLSSGALLVSSSYALFCRVPSDDVSKVRSAIEGTPAELPPPLVASLREHGFGGSPRPSRPPAPSVQIQLTNACNLSCAYCCTNSGAPRNKEIDRDTAFAVIDDVAKVLGKGTRVALLGGEPLLVPWAVDLAERVIDEDLLLTLFTNGIPLNRPELAQRLGALCQRGAQVRVSLAGATAAVCDRVSGAPRFDQVIAGINNLASFGPPPSVDLMLLPNQVDDVTEHLSELRKMLPATTPVALGVPYLSGREQGKHLFASRAQLEEMLDRIAFEAGETIAAPETKTVADRREGCTCALGQHLHVRSDGTLFTCFKMEERVGDLNTMSFEEGLLSLQASARPATTLPYCRDCPLATLCGGGCRSENLQYTGDGDLPVCGPWRVQVIAEMLAEDRVTCLEWPAPHLLAEAQVRGIEAPVSLRPVVLSRHLTDV